MDKISCAQLSGDEWVETSPEIIKHYNRNGLNGAKYFIYQGIKVCETGKLEEVIKETTMTMGQKVFGPGEAVIQGL